MKKQFREGFKVIIICSFLSASLFSCKKQENQQLYTSGEFPDSTISIKDINSVYDDYNVAVYDMSIVFSSNRGSSGGQFDMVQGQLTFTFDLKTGDYGLGSEMTSDAFLSKLLKAANTSGNDFGPFRFFSSYDGYDYMILSSANTNGDLDFYYLKNRPVFGSNNPDVLGPYPITLLNTDADDAYICFDTNQDSLYFSTDKDGNFNIYVKKRPSETDLTTWFNKEYSASSLVDSINTDSDDKCPVVKNKIMVFASNRPGGLGGYDLYYSLFKKGKWGSPKNFGPKINTSSDEYRPFLFTHEDFSNYILIFSSDRPGGKGGFDLYMRGVSFTN